jgi:hypothetical protein
MVYCPDAYISRATWSFVAAQDRPPATVAAADPGRGQHRGSALPDQVAFELGQGRENVEHQLAARSGGVDRLLQTPEPDAVVGEAGDGVDQVTQGPAEAVELPDDQGVAGTQLVQDLLKDRSVGAGAAGGLGEHPIAAGALQGVDRELEVLVGGGDAGIAEQMTHAHDRRRRRSQGGQRNASARTCEGV